MKPLAEPGERRRVALDGDASRSSTARRVSRPELRELRLRREKGTLMSLRTTALVVTALLLLVTSAQARTVTVDTAVDNGALSACDDVTPNDCSLRGALNAAGAAAEHYDIVLPAGTYPNTQTVSCSFHSGLHNGTFNETGTALCVHRDVAILGAGADRTFMDGMNTGRVLIADVDSTVAISGVTITHGYFVAGSFIGRAGGILAHGPMTLTDVVLTANTGGDGAAINSVGDLRMERCQVIANNSAGDGAGINNAGDGLAVPRKTFTLIDSTVASNSATGQAGGIYTAHKTAKIVGSTFNNNTATGAGGVIRNSVDVGMTIVDATFAGNSGYTGGAVSADSCATCAVSFENVTITGNHANQGGGGVSISSRPTIANSIVTANTTSGYGPNCLGAGFLSRGHNIFGDLRDCNPTTGDTTGDQNNVADPRLGGLVLNGGLTATMIPLDSSPALEHGSPAAPGSGDGACAVVDQRGVLRPLGDRCDVGAAERSAALGVTTVTPTHAGNEGSAMLAIGGGGFVDGATVALRRAGHADIVADPVVVDGGGSSIAASFALNGADLGAWDVVVTNPDAAIVVLPAGFTVEAVVEPSVFAAVLGRSAVRAGVPSRYTIRYGNDGNVEALAVPLTLIVPAAFAPAMRFEIALPPEQPGRPFNDYSEVPLAATTDVAGASASLTFIVPVIPAGFTGILEFTLTPPADTPHDTTFDVDVLIGKPMFANGAVRSEILADAATAARAFAERTLGVTTTPALDPVLITYERNALELAVSTSRDALAKGFGQSGRVYSAAFTAIDLAGYAGAQAGAIVSLRALWRDIGVGLGILTEPAFAGTVCPPCVRGGVLPPGCSCADNPSTGPAPDDPKKPPKPMTPAECREIPNHRVSADGSQCEPRDTDGCSRIPVFGQIFSTDPRCRSWPIRGSIDPNDKSGSGGAGPTHAILPGTTLPYMIAFENKPEATLPAQVVVVTDQLDVATLDLDSFALGPITVGDVTITPPADVRTFSGGADLRPALDVLMKVDAGLDPDTGVVTWVFATLDPLTGQLTEDPEAGFLPPNTSPPAGDGQVNFTIKPKTGLATGTTIRNKASIVFDVNAPIDTPEWTNAIDDAAPTSQVDSIEPACGANDLTLHWSGTDGETGAGVSTYSVYVSVDGGAYAPVVTDTTELSAPFTAEVGRTYRFYSIARDHLHHVEAAPAQPDVTRTIGACGIHDLAIAGITAPAKVSLTAKNPQKLGKVAVLVENRGPVAEVIPDATKLAQLVTLDVVSLAAGCADPVATLHAGKPQKPLPITVKPKRRFTVLFDVTFGCANDAASGAGHADFRLSAHVNRAALGDPDSHPVDDVCPRSVTPPYVIDPYPDGKIRDKGCGAKKPDKTRGGDVLIDVSSR